MIVSVIANSCTLCCSHSSSWALALINLSDIYWCHNGLILSRLHCWSSSCDWLAILKMWKKRHSLALACSHECGTAPLWLSLLYSWLISHSIWSSIHCPQDYWRSHQCRQLHCANIPHLACFLRREGARPLSQRFRRYSGRMHRNDSRRRTHRIAWLLRSVLAFLHSHLSLNLHTPPLSLKKRSECLRQSTIAIKLLWTPLSKTFILYSSELRARWPSSLLSWAHSRNQA